MEKQDKIKLLHRASKSGDVAQLEDILQDSDLRESVNRRAGNNKVTPLHEACMENQTHVVDALLKCETIKVDTSDGRHWTPLCYAVDNGNLEIVKKLLVKGANVKHVLNNGDTPLHLSAMKGHFNICKMLIKYEADVTASNYNNWTPLHVATGEMDYDLARLFLNNGAKVDVKTTFGDSPSNMAARNDSENILQLLKEKHADFNIKNKNGEAPVHSASMGGHAHTLKYLAQNGAEIMSNADKNLNIFHFAAKNGHTDIFYSMTEILSQTQFNQLLCAKTDHISGMWVSTIGCGLILSNVTPLHFAALEGHPAVVTLLLQAGASNEDTDAHGYTPTGLVNHFKPQMQTWDMDNISMVLDILENFTNGSNKESHTPTASAEQRLFHYDSDYHSTSSYTTEDMENSLGDLEQCIQQLEIGEANIKYCHRKRRALKKQVDRGLLSGAEKDKIYNKLSSLENTLQIISERGVAIKSKPVEMDRISRASSSISPGCTPLTSKKSDEIVKRFRAHFTTFLNELNVEDHMHYLFQQGALELDEIEKIDSKETDNDKIKTLLYSLYGKHGSVWTQAFVSSLENSPQTSHLAALLMN